MVMDAIERIAIQAIENAVHEIAGKMVTHSAGVDTEVKAIIRAEIQEMFKGDEDLRRLLRERIVYWIERQ
jgi:hypothetical protein